MCLRKNEKDPASGGGGVSDNATTRLEKHDDNDNAAIPAIPAIPLPKMQIQFAAVLTARHNVIVRYLSASMRAGESVAQPQQQATWLNRYTVCGTCLVFKAKPTAWNRHLARAVTATGLGSVQTTDDVRRARYDTDACQRSTTTMQQSPPQSPSQAVVVSSHRQVLKSRRQGPKPSRS